MTKTVDNDSLCIVMKADVEGPRGVSWGALREERLRQQVPEEDRVDIKTERYKEERIRPWGIPKEGAKCLRDSQGMENGEWSHGVGQDGDGDKRNMS